MYQKFNPKRAYGNICSPDSGYVDFNQRFFEEDVVSVCSATYLHHLPYRCFANSKIDRSKATVAFLLKLSDSLREWERPSFSNPTGFPSTQFAINLEKNLVLRADIPTEKKEMIENDISSVLIATDVKIQ